MNASRSTDWVVMCAAGGTIAGLAAGVPLAAAAAGALALLAVAARRPLAPDIAASPGRRRRDCRPVPKTQITTLLWAFQGHPGRELPGRTDEDAPETEQPEVAEEGSAAFEEFTAGLEDDDGEEISFLPPYVSGRAEETDDADDDAAAADWEPVPRPAAGDPALLKDLPDLVESRSKMPVPRRFALGTVAVLRNLLDPRDVESILIEQRRYPALRFGDAAVQLGLLTEAQRDELVRAQQDGIFTDDEIRRAKSRLESYSRR